HVGLPRGGGEALDSLRIVRGGGAVPDGGGPTRGPVGRRAGRGRVGADQVPRISHVSSEDRSPDPFGNLGGDAVVGGGRKESLVVVDIKEDTQPELAGVRAALHLAALLLCSTQCGKQQGGEDRDDGDDHQQLNQRE